jgi:hypothetical protein
LPASASSFNDLIQAVHRCYRFLQAHPVRCDLIYSEAERDVRRALEEKWERYGELVCEHERDHPRLRLGASCDGVALASATSAVLAHEAVGDNYRLVNADSVEETASMPDASVG